MIAPVVDPYGLPCGPTDNVSQYGGDSLEAPAFSSTGPCSCLFYALRRVKIDIVQP